ncbi:uncharacterized protein LOC134527975 isoform X2 [Bacillus rossius redtenbacheri]|uniref:uncharacterized protein LOC134527975 isoform X2 n=1 Tax=Bacillus rossius redtenbacheri TaxID=93214 RepID=UPI002FDE109B
MEFTGIVTVVLVLGCFSCICQSIYIPGRDVTKPPLRREILVRPPLHERIGVGVNNATDYTSLEQFDDGILLINVGHNKPEYRPIKFADEVEKDASSEDGKEVPSTQVPFIETVTGLRWTPGTYGETAPGRRVVVTCPKGTTGQFPYPPNCMYFLNCWKGRGFVQPCAPGTLFNPRTLECDFPGKVKCLPYREVEERPARAPVDEPEPRPPESPEERPRTSTEAPPVPSTTVTHSATESTTAPTSTTTHAGTASTTPDTSFLAEHLDASGQVLRLRGGSGPWEGYVQMRDSGPGWGLVCDDFASWTIQEAHVVCRQLGFERGAEFAWQGRPVRPTDDTLKVSVDAVTCSGDEATLQGCRLARGRESCLVARDAVGVRCRLNSASQCAPGDANHGGRCYALVEEGRAEAFTHGEAIQHCQLLGGHLLDINSQAENDFISEWLIQLKPEITSIITSGVGVNVGGSSLWIWESSKKLLSFEKWWPGWTREYGGTPQISDKPLCLEATRMFPCDMSYYSSQEQEDRKMCAANYFYWDTEDCSVSHSHPYICEKPRLDIGCANGAGDDYDGPANVTVNGEPCLDWDLEEVLPYVWPRVSAADMASKLSGHNHCRNVGGSESQPWCYVGPRGKMDLCDIPPCWSSDILRNPSEETFKCGSNQFQCGMRECIESTWLCDGHKDCSNGRDELHCTRSLSRFTLHEASRLTGHDVEKWIQASPNACARRCLEVKHFKCLSFSYNSEDGSCVLSNSNIGMSGNLQAHEKWNYYERKSGTVNCAERFLCANGKCINASAECNGKNDCGDRSDERNCSTEYLDYGIRLAGGKTLYEGRVEVKVFGRWGVVCDDQFGPRDAGVVCRELGFSLGAADVRPSSYFWSRDTSPLFLVDELQCFGNETSLRECDFNGWGVHDCTADEVAGVVCKQPGMQCPDGKWQCQYSEECISVALLCDSVADCDDGSDESSACEAGAQLRLAGGSSGSEGRVEVLHMGVWGTVCDDDFTPATAAVVCRALGLQGPAEVRKNALFGPGDGPIWLHQLQCAGNESRLEDCFHAEWGRHNCQHDEDVGVVCSPGRVSRGPDQTELVNASIPDSENSVFPGANLLPSECGVKNLEGSREDGPGVEARVVQGKVVVKGMYPWQASVRVRGPSKSAHWCGAVIVSPLHVLTAAHCLTDYSKEHYFVRVADHDTEAHEGTEQEANIEEIYFHEKFNKGSRLNNDIALVRLKGRGVMLGGDARPICLPSPNVRYTPGLNCTVSGWGQTKASISGHSRRLQATWLPILPRDTCKASFVYGAAVISEGMFCAGHLEGGVDACQGDSGGPLVCLHEGHFTLFGIVSWGQGCGRPNKPGVYSNIAYYRTWIDQKLQDSATGR